MSISLTIDLNDRDLAHFNNAMQTARKAAEGKAPEEVIEAAGTLLVDAQKVHVPDFILERLLQLDNMIAMVRSVTGTARALHVGSSTQVWEIRIEDERGRLACISRLTLAVVKRS